jgi:predicted ATPase
LNLILVREPERRLPSMRRLGAIMEAIRNGDGVHDLLQEAAPGAGDGTDRQQARPSVQHKLPARAAPFIGRDQEMATVASFLTNSQTRLLTILGPGGMGKTRLALAAARRFLSDASAASSFADGLYFVPLAPLENGEKIVQAMADALDLAFETTATAARTPRRQLLDFLSDRRLLLILDNFEHVLDGVGLVSDILRQAPGIKIVATSREQLNLREEHLLALQGLQHPPPTGAGTRPVGDFEAVRLFIQSARRTRPDFVLTEENAHAVAEICRLVEGMPLAVGLTAAWLDILPVADVVEEVQRNLDFLETDKRDVPVRQRSIRAVFETAWQRLEGNEQAAFARLSVFRAGFERRAAVEIADITLRMLRHLVGKSLLHYDSAVDRYQIHDLLRQYAMQKLEESGGGDEVLDRHSAYFCAALQRYQAEIEGSNKQAALAAIERDAGNIFAAWHWALAHGQVRRLDQAMHSLEHFFYWRSRIHEAEAFYGKAAAQLATMAPATGVGQTEHQCAVAALQARHANFGYLLQNWDEARKLFRASLATYETLEKKEECDVRREKAYILMKMGDVTRDLQEAQSHFEKSLALYDAVGHRWWAAGLHCHLGYVALAQGRYEEAREWFEKSLALYRELDDRWQFGWVLDGLSNVALYQQDLAEAEKLAQESLAIHREIGLRDRIADNLTTLCWIALAQGKQEAAQAYRQEALQIWQALGLEERINLPLGLEDQPFTPRWFSDIIDRRMGAVFERSAQEGEGDA